MRPSNNGRKEIGNLLDQLYLILTTATVVGVMTLSFPNSLRAETTPSEDSPPPSDPAVPADTQDTPSTQDTEPTPPSEPNADQRAPASAAPSETEKKPLDQDKFSEDPDYSDSPFTRYGEFHESEDEEADDKFFQFARFFGVSVGIGTQFLDGNRGALWQGGFPVFDFKFHYWFTFDLAVDLGFNTAIHYFDTTAPTQAPLGHVDTNMVRVGVDLKYYLPVQDLSAVISFANPYLIVGAGSYSKTQNSNYTQTQEQDTSMGVCGGGGLEFVVSPRKTYIALEFKANGVIFKDTYTTLFQSVGLTNLTGNFYTLTANFLFTW